MRRIGPVFNEDHRPDIRFRPTYHIFFLFVKKHGFLYQKTPRVLAMQATCKHPWCTDMLHPSVCHRVVGQRQIVGSVVFPEISPCDKEPNVSIFLTTILPNIYFMEKHVASNMTFSKNMCSQHVFTMCSDKLLLINMLPYGTLWYHRVPYGTI